MQGHKRLNLNLVQGGTKLVGKEDSRQVDMMCTALGETLRLSSTAHPSLLLGGKLAELDLHEELKEQDPPVF